MHNLFSQMLSFITYKVEVAYIKSEHQFTALYCRNMYIFYNMLGDVLTVFHRIKNF